LNCRTSQRRRVPRRNSVRNPHPFDGFASVADFPLVMCGRYTLKNPDALAAAYAVAAALIESLGARYNVAPSQDLPVVFRDGDRTAAARMAWGLVPSWERAAKPRLAPTNARSEEALQKPLFRAALQKRRCLVPADGFYEWRRVGEKTKVPHHIQMTGGRPFAMAGIYEEASDLRPATFALLTTGPNELMVPIHDRMPVILTAEGERRWLAEEGLDEAVLRRLATPFPAAEMEAFTVSTVVNNARHDTPDCARPAPYLEEPTFPW